MRIIVNIGLLCVAISVAGAEIGPQERMKRGTYNVTARAKIILRCVDQNGLAVSNATVSSALYPFGGDFKDAIVKNGVTDNNGCFVMEGKTDSEFSYTLTKDGFYKTREIKQLNQFQEVFVKNGRWQPYGMTNTVVLKRKVNPVAMYVAGLRKKHTLIREVGEPMGFDLTVGDWVSPRGRGKTPDFHVTYIRDGSGRDYTALELILSAEEPFAGFIKVPCDTFSQFKSPYRADTNAVYAKEMRFSFRRNEKGRYEDGQLQADECLILRTRTRLDKEGRLVGAHYGKIYGPLRFGFSFDAPGEMKILHYLNPNENDPNLEADTSRNLLNPKDLGFAP